MDKENESDTYIFCDTLMDRKNGLTVLVGENGDGINLRYKKNPNYKSRVFHVAVSVSRHILASDLPKQMNVTANR